MNPQKFSNVIEMDGPARYSYFVRKVADTERIWGLEQSGWATAEDDTAALLIPFWPEEAFARASATGAWTGYTAREIGLEEFLDKWLTGMHRDGIKVAVFPNAVDRGVVVDAEALRSALMRERAQYE